MKQTFNIYAKGTEEGIAGQARNDTAFRMKQLFTFVLIFVFAITTTAQTFITIEGSRTVYPNSISSDGKYVVGQVDLGNEMYGHHTFVWTKEDGIRELDQDIANSYNEGSTAWGVSLSGRLVGMSPDSTHIVNTYDDGVRIPLITAAFRDLDSEKWRVFPLLPNVNTPFAGFGSRAYAISDDGNIVVGGQTPGGQAQRWSAGYWDISNPENIVYHAVLTNAQYGYGSLLQAVSGDGTVMGGYETDNNKNYTVLWIEGVKKRITAASGNPVKAISRNGKYAIFQSELKAVLYDITKDELSKFDQGTKYSTPLAVSDKGVVVGYWGNNTYLGGENRKAFIYSKTSGMIAFDDYLRDSGVTSLLDSILVVSGISADGTKVTGFGMKNRSIVSFYAEIPDISGGLAPVRNVYAQTPVYGTIELTWDAPENTAEDASVLVAYKIYEGETLLTTVGPTVNAYTLENIADGTYSYSVKAVYDVAGETLDAIAGKTVAITTGKKTLPFYDSFSSYQPKGYVFDLGQVVEGIPLSTGLWDVSANSVPFSSSWHVNQSGIPPYSAGFVAPQSGVYSESLSSPYFDLRDVQDLSLSFEIYVPVSSSEKMAVEVYDGTQWNEVAIISAVGQVSNFTNRSYNISQYAGRNNVRFRFRCFGTATEGINWFVDNVELTDDANKVIIKPPLVVSARNAENNTVHVNWSDPYGNVTLRYMLDDNAYGSVSNDVLPYVAANMYPAKDLTAYEGYKLTSISFWRTTNSSPASPLGIQPHFRWFVSQGGERLYSEEVVNPQLRWNTIQLTDPIPVDITKPLYYGVEVVTCDPNDWPIGSGTYSVPGPGGSDVFLTKIDGRGNLYSEDNGQTWKKMSDDGADYVYDLFCIRATLAKYPDAQSPRRIIGYKIFRGNRNLILDEWGSDYSIELNNFTDTHPLPEGSESCYTVQTYYSYYTGHVASEGTTDCITINGINLIQEESGLKVYPNPVKRNETIRIETANSGIRKGSSLQIYDVSGKAVKIVKMEESVTPVRLDVEAGTYILKINGGKAVKLIVE